MEGSIEVIVNGETRTCPGNWQITDLLNHAGWAPKLVIVEHNGVALHRNQLTETALQNGDRLEVVRIVAGG